LYKVGEATASAVRTPPLGKLGTLRSVAVSPDLKWLAMSGRTRGGEWSIEKNTRIMLTRSFQRASYAEDSSLLVDFPSFEKNERELVVVDPGMREPRRRIPPNDKDHIDLFGNIYVRTKSRNAKPSLQNLLMEALDRTSDHQLWSHSFSKQSPRGLSHLGNAAPRLSMARQNRGLPPEMTLNTELAKRWKSVNAGVGDVFAGVVNAQDGAPSGGVVVHTGRYWFRRNMWRLPGMHSCSRTIATAACSIRWFPASAKLHGLGRGQGFPAAASICAFAAGRGRLTIYDLLSLKQTAEFSFAALVVSHTLSADGSRLFALTNDQTILFSTRRQRTSTEFARFPARTQLTLFAARLSLAMAMRFRVNWRRFRP
jgi:hypothetical protein